VTSNENRRAPELLLLFVSPEGETIRSFSGGQPSIPDEGEVIILGDVSVGDINSAEERATTYDESEYAVQSVRRIYTQTTATVDGEQYDYDVPIVLIEVVPVNEVDEEGGSE